MMLIKQGQIKQALETYIELKKYQEAEEFCVKFDEGAQLFTNLFEIYIQRYQIRFKKRVKSLSAAEDEDVNQLKAEEDKY